MASTERVTVTLPASVLERIDRLERNRSRFITQAVEHELARRKRRALLRSLQTPHPEAAELAEVGMSEWSASFAEEDAEGLVDASTGTSVRWVAGEGWRESER